MRKLCRNLSVVSIVATLFSSAALAGTGHGTFVKVLYAGSLAHVMQHAIRPAFENDSKDSFEGFTAGSNKLASEIKGKVRRGDVFLSAHPSVNDKLMGQSNGNWVDSYATFMRSPLVLGYNPHSQFASALKSGPWYKVITQSGIRVGRTDPKLDPKGRLIVQAIKQIAKKENEPQLKQKILDHARVYPEQGLVGRLQSGQIDAGFFYKGEAAAAGIPTVPISPIKLGAVYTVTLLNRAPHKAAASDFIRFLLGHEGTRILKKNGFDVLSPIKIAGNSSAMPGALSSILNPG